MPRHLRVFVSSTMQDLANERAEVIRKLESFNFEPVNAENWLPDGRRVWDRIEQEIESSDVLVAILGERYGWIPDSGPQAGKGLSVTHLEINKAVELGVPILAFLKRLSYHADHESADARARDALRKIVSRWTVGITYEFELAYDLAQSVARALIELLTVEFLRGRVSARAAEVRRNTLALAAEHASEPVRDQIRPPAELVRSARERRVVLLAGAGVSVDAGLPSAAALGAAMQRTLGREFTNYRGVPTIESLATDIQLTFGRQTLLHTLRSFLFPPQGLEPTLTHTYAARLFDCILTTNYDTLFEQAAGNARPVIADELATASLPRSAIVKLSGSIDSPGSLAFAQTDVARLDTLRPNLWTAVVELLRRNSVLIVGSSLADRTTQQLLADVGEAASGYFVSTRPGAIAAAQLRSWNIEAIQADANTFLAALMQEVNG